MDPRFAPCTAELIFAQQGRFILDESSTLRSMEAMLDSLGATSEGEVWELRRNTAYLRFEFDDEHRLVLMDFEPLE